ncbi:response regulator transcription factor [Clostridium grantii]|uniref:Stage 0 sporulation protein A homolog n=1 Tax=Clostridium grantii DSM 8605 TaxID=1121316 RepID=A0A1M5VB84_9CLOT|nr:response regulator [Clostridium grantii]SHH72509.1 Helix-turn-helix domain-containing protein [Clostridium grantii DSM 8605]
MEKIRVLLIDDDEVIREGMKDSIPWDELGFEVIGEADNGKSGIDIINNKEPDMVILDIKMPQMDGLEVSTWIRKNYPEIKIMLLSGYSDFEYARRAIREKVIEYALKPVYKPDFIDLLKNIKSKIIIEQDNKIQESIHIKINEKYKVDEKSDNKINEKRIIKECVSNMRQQYKTATLASIAEQSYLSPNYLSFLFKMETGQTFIDTLTQIKIDKAKELLKNKHYKIYEVAEELGYKDSRYFSHIFKKYTGISPKDF